MPNLLAPNENHYRFPAIGVLVVWIVAKLHLDNVFGVALAEFVGRALIQFGRQALVR